MKKDNLKIQLRAVKHGSYSKALEYRIDPDQDITYEDVPSNFFGRLLNKLGWKFVKTFDTFWHQPRIFSYPITMELYEFDDDFNWGPIWCDEQETLDNFKKMFKTYGDLCLYCEKHNATWHEKWEKEREKYLEESKTLY